LLRVENINAFYSSIQVLRDVSFDIQEKEIVSMIGANGAGKTTILRTISGLLSPRSGTIQFLGKKIDRLAPHRIVDLGLVQIPEGRKLFPTLTALENLRLGAFHSSARVKREESLKKVFEIFPLLEERKDQLAGTLSGGEQQMLAIGRGLMSLPKLLMLDEPSLGLAPLIIREIFKVINEINKQGTTVLLVEQNVMQSLALANRGYVLENGIIVLSGESEDLLNNEYTKRAFMGM